MPSLLTPSRLAVLALSLTLFTFLWTWGIPRAVPEPLPIINHNGPKAPLEFEKSPATKAQTTAILDGIISPIPTPSIVSSSIPASILAPFLQTTTRDATWEPEETETAQGDVHNGTLVQTAHGPYPTGRNSTINRHYTNSTTADIDCKTLPGASDILVILRTSKSSSQTIKPAFDTLLSCVPDLVLFSDHSGTYKNYTIHDALEGVSAATKEEHRDFENYENLLSQEDTGGKLDKWTILPSLYQSFKQHPDKRFYLVLTPSLSTSLSWNNLLLWTSRLEYRNPFYYGAPLALHQSFSSDILKFAQPAPGILISNAAMRAYVKAYDEKYSEAWEKRVPTLEMGEIVLGSAMKDANVDLYNSWPMMQNEAPRDVTWKRESWCMPAISWGNVPMKEQEKMWRFEKNWTRENRGEEPYLMRDAFEAFVLPRLVEKKEDWDNEAQDTPLVKPALADLDDEALQAWFAIPEEGRLAVTSKENCQMVCEVTEDCHQWRYTASGEGECHMGRTIKYGKKAEKDGVEEGMWTSGWIVERIRNTTREWECREPKWSVNGFN